MRNAFVSSSTSSRTWEYTLICVSYGKSSTRLVGPLSDNISCLCEERVGVPKFACFSMDCNGMLHHLCLFETLQCTKAHWVTSKASWFPGLVESVRSSNFVEIIFPTGQVAVWPDMELSLPGPRGWEFKVSEREEEYPPEVCLLWNSQNSRTHTPGFYPIWLPKPWTP